MSSNISSVSTIVVEGFVLRNLKTLHLKSACSEDRLIIYVFPLLTASIAFSHSVTLIDAVWLATKQSTFLSCLLFLKTSWIWSFSFIVFRVTSKVLYNSASSASIDHYCCHITRGNMWIIGEFCSSSHDFNFFLDLEFFICCRKA